MEFVALDLETANADMASICSLGAARFSHGTVVEEYYTLLNPKDYFDPMNISIHGITESAVMGAPNFADIAPELDRLLSGAVVVTHSHFDRVATHQAAERWTITPPACTWLDSARVTRRTWADCAQRGYGLANVCKKIGYTFQHHNALEDAKAAGHVLLAAMSETGLDLPGWLTRVDQPIDPRSAAPISRTGRPDGPMHGEVLVFTGALAMTRAQAADLAASIGCDVGRSVTKQTTLLVVGDIDITKLNGQEKSGKHRKAEQLGVRIIRETDFMKLVQMA
jgi:DNA polymerase-3 subunit epsilon